MLLYMILLLVSLLYANDYTIALNTCAAGIVKDYHCNDINKRPTKVKYNLALEYCSCMISTPHPAITTKDHHYYCILLSRACDKGHI